MKEIWKDIIGYEGFYLISNTGKVKGIKRNKIKNPSLNSWGYKVIGLTKPKTKLKTLLVHRLVAIMFIDNPDNKSQVNHIDGNKLNNNDWNLEWSTGYENQQHAFSLGLNINHRGEKHNRSVLTEEMYFESISLRKQKLTYSEISDFLFKKFGVKIGRTTINAALLGQTWSHIKTENLRKYGNREPKAGY